MTKTAFLAVYRNTANVKIRFEECFPFPRLSPFARCEIWVQSHGFSLLVWNFSVSLLPPSLSLTVSLVNLFTVKSTFLLAEFALTILYWSHTSFLRIIFEQFTCISLTTARGLYSFKNKTYPISKTNLRR